MSISQEQFDALVKKHENFSKSNPQSYRLRVALFAVLGYAYIFLVLAGLLALITLIVLFIAYSRRISGGIIKLMILLLIPVWVIIRSLWVKFPPPEGLKLSRRQVPHLFALVDELTTKLQAPKFHNILLNQEFNAAVYQVPRLGIFGWQENYLLLGLPLMQSLSVEEFKAVVAHELGHLSGNHSRFGGWIYRIRKTWMQIYERLNQSQEHGTSILFNRFLNWYWPSFNSYSFVLARMNEYEADRCSAELVGANNTAKALMNIEVKASFLETSFWTDIQEQVKHQVEPPNNVYSSMLTILNRPIAENKSQQWLEQAFAQKTNNVDTHPCLTERLKSLGYSTAEAQKLLQPTEKQITAAENLLGSILQKLTMQFNRDWKETASTPWRQRYGYLQEIKGKLQALEEKSETEQELWERAYYTLELKGQDISLPLLQNVLNQYPDHAQANYTLGQILLEKADTTGINYIEKAIQQRVNWAIDGYELVYNFLCQQGKNEEAQQYIQKAEQHYQLMLKAEQERNTVTDKDKFKPHSLEASEVNKIKQQLVDYPQIKEAYLVEKVVTYFPEEPFCVLGIVRKRNLLESDSAPYKLINLLAENLRFPAQSYIVILNHSTSGKLKQKIEQIDQSLIFRS